jgi:site-specific recombinase XerD
VTPRCERRDRGHSASASLSDFPILGGERLIPYKKRMSPYIQRMVGDMQLRNMADRTIDAYTCHAEKFCLFFGKPAEQLGPEEIRQYQLYLVNENKASWSTFNQATCGLRFFYEVTLAKPWAVRHIPFGKRPKKLPVVLSNEEASRLLECFSNPKHRAVTLTCYAAGLSRREQGITPSQDVYSSSLRPRTSVTEDLQGAGWLMSWSWAG